MSAESCGSGDGLCSSEIVPDILTSEDLTQEDQLDCFSKQEIVEMWRKSEQTLRLHLQQLSQQKAALEIKLSRLQKELRPEPDEPP